MLSHALPQPREPRSNKKTARLLENERAHSRARAPRTVSDDTLLVQSAMPPLTVRGELFLTSVLHGLDCIGKIGPLEAHRTTADLF